MEQCSPGVFLLWHNNEMPPANPNPNPTPPPNPEEDIRARLTKHFFLRGHMVGILLGVLISGLLADKILLRNGVTNLQWRYQASLLFSYFCFFVFVRLWCWLILPRQASQSSSSSFSLDGIDGISNISFRGAGKAAEAGFRGAGGAFGGGGSSATWEAGDVARAAVIDQAAGPSGGFAQGAGDVIGSAVGDKDGLVLLAFALVVAVFFGAIIFMVWSAPALLSGAAFHVLFAGGLVHGARREPVQNWAVGLFRRTWWVFALVLAVSATFCYQAQTRCVGVTTLPGALFDCHAPVATKPVE